MVTHGDELMVTGLLDTVSVAYVCGMVVTRGILVPPGTQNNTRFLLEITSNGKINCLNTLIFICNMLIYAPRLWL